MTTPLNPRLVVFDLDGTLLDSLTLVLQAIEHALKPYGSRPTRDIFAHLGGPPDRFLPLLLGDAGNLGEALERMESYHQANMHLIRPFDGAARLLERLRSAGRPMAVWTGRDRASASTLLRDHGMAHWFDTVICGDDLPSHKPDPAGLMEILRRMRVGATETLFVGDADVDVLGGAACGVRTLLIRHARHIEPAISAKSWRTAASPAEAFEIVLDSLQSEEA